MRRNTERTAWFNGRLIPESEVSISPRDLGWLHGDTAFDAARTFRGKPFRLREHVERLYDSLAYLQIDPGFGIGQMLQITEEVIESNIPLLEPHGDYWVHQRISRGIQAPEGEAPAYDGPTIIVNCTPLTLRSRADGYINGIEVLIPSVRRTPPESMSPRAKMCNYINLTLGNLEVKAQNKDAWAVLLDKNGNLAEGEGSNIFLVKDGVVRTPREDFVLPGISRRTVIELAAGLGIECLETDLSLFDTANADEAFLTSTSLCLCPVRSINGVSLGANNIPGPVTAQLMQAYKDLVNCDFEAQCVRFVGGKPGILRVTDVTLSR